jgi:DNA-binding PadR family transcriptional regulator
MTLYDRLLLYVSRTKRERTLEDRIISLLHDKDAPGPSLLAKVREEEAPVSKETFYRALRRLLEQEVVSKQNEQYQLNHRWLLRIYRFSKNHIEASRGIDKNEVLSFQEGDKVSYKFRTPNLMGMYWGHLYDMVFDLHDPTIPILSFHPHNWFIHTRTRSETFFLNRFEEDKKLAFLAIGGKTPVDKAFKKDWESRYRQIGLGIDMGLKKTEYINVLGDFIFKVSVSKKCSDDIESFFKKNPEITAENRAELAKIANRNDPARVVFMRSKKEAQKWRAKFKKHFFVPKD